MRLQRIRLVNFRSFVRSDFELGDPRTLIVGQTGTGKSSILDAIALVLTGQCRGTDARGAGAKDLIRHGQQSAEITLWIEGWKPIVRTLAREGAGSGVSPDQIIGKLGVSKDMLRAVLDGSVFFALDHGAARTMLLRALDAVVKPTDFTRDEWLLLKRFDPDVDGSMDEAGFAIEDIDRLYKSFYAKRTEAKRMLDAIIVPDDPRVVDMEVGKFQGTSLEEARSKAQAASREYVDASRILAGERGRLSVLRTQLASYEKLAGAPLGELRGQLETHIGLLAEEEAKQVAVEARIKELANAEPEVTPAAYAQRTNLKAFVERIGAHDPANGCVLDAAIPCLTKASKFTAHVKALSKEITALDADLQAAETARRQTERERGAVDEQRRSVMQSVRYHGEQVTKLRERIVAAESASASLANLREEIAESEAAEKSQTFVVDRDGATADAAGAFAASMQKWAQAQQQRSESLERREAQAARVSDLETLVALFGPKGIRSKVLDLKLEDFEQAVNAALEPNGYSVELLAEPWTVRVNGRAYSLLSTGEKVLIGATFQQVFAVISDLDFMLVDAAEATTGEARSALSMLMMQSPVAQIVMAMAKDPTDERPHVEGLSVIDLEPVRMGMEGRAV